MKEHIEQLELLARCTPELTRAALRTAIELMNAAEPKDEADEYVDVVRAIVAACPKQNRTVVQRSGARAWEWEVTLAMKLRAQARAEGYMQASAGVGMQEFRRLQNRFEDTQAELRIAIAQLSAAQAEVERLKAELSTERYLLDRVNAAETQLSAAQAEIERLTKATCDYLAALDLPMSNEAASQIAQTEIRLRTTLCAKPALVSETVGALASLQETYERAHSRACSAESKLAFAQAEIDRLQNGVNAQSYREQIAALEAKLSNLRAATKRFRAAVKSMATERELAEVDAAIEGSR